MNNNVVKVEHIQASVCAATGQRIDTLIAEYPRAIHSQVLTHRVFSKNSSSTRAIPLSKAIDQINAKPAKYIWTKNQSGMQGEVITDSGTLHDLEETFYTARENAMYAAQKLATLGGAHKQNAGRLLEPFQNIRIVLTSTEWENWDWLRNHEDAQGEINVLAQAIYAARQSAIPMVLAAGEWHVPFVDRNRHPVTKELLYSVEKDGAPLMLDAEEAKLISMSVCAQTSYRKSDYSLEKAIVMRARLLEPERVHSSPSEHQATPITYIRDHLEAKYWEDGVTHMDRHGKLWSGNFKGFIQHRQLLPRHDKAKF